MGDLVAAIWLPDLLWQAECVGRTALKDRPVLVGGAPARGGTVAAASPAARARGVRVGQPVGEALRFCVDAVRFPGCVDRLLDVAAVVQTRLEALLGPVAWPTLGRAVAVVAPSLASRLHGALDELRDEAASTLGVSVACGIAPTWIGAEVAARLMAPAGLLHVVPRSQRRMLAPLSVKWLPGVDSDLVARLARSGVHTLGELAELEPGLLHRLVGRSGAVLARLANGVDDRRVPGGIPLRRVAACVASGGGIRTAVASLIELAARAGRPVAAARVRCCALQDAHADRVDLVQPGPYASLSDLERALLTVAGESQRREGPTLVSLLFAADAAPSRAAHAVVPRRRTA